MGIHIKNKEVEAKIRTLAEKQSTSYVQAVNNAVTHLLENHSNSVPLTTKEKEARFRAGVEWLKTSAWPYMHKGSGMSDEEIEDALGYNDMM